MVFLKWFFSRISSPFQGGASLVDLVIYLSLPYHHVCFLQPWGHLLGKADLLALLNIVCEVFVTFPYAILGQVWDLIVSIPDWLSIFTILCLLRAIGKFPL